MATNNHPETKGRGEENVQEAKVREQDKEIESCGLWELVSFYLSRRSRHCGREGVCGIGGLWSGR